MTLVPHPWLLTIHALTTRDCNTIRMYIGGPDPAYGHAPVIVLPHGDNACIAPGVFW